MAINSDNDCTVGQEPALELGVMSKPKNI